MSDGIVSPDVCFPFCIINRLTTLWGAESCSCRRPVVHNQWTCAGDCRAWGGVSGKTRLTGVSERSCLLCCRCLACKSCMVRVKKVEGHLLCSCCQMCHDCCSCQFVDGRGCGNCGACAICACECSDDTHDPQ
eukprot:3933863-Rhodomonas_salina.1